MGDKKAGYCGAYVPIYSFEKLPIMVVAICQLIGSNQDVPAAGLLRSDRVVEHFPQLWTFVLVCVVCLDVDVVSNELLKLSTPIL